MLHATEDIFMVTKIHDLANIKHIESDSHLKAKQETDTPADYISSLNNINVSDTSKQLEALKASLQDIPEINEARVLYFKAEIESGAYQIQSQKIAQNMLSMEIA